VGNINVAEDPQTSKKHYQRATTKTFHGQVKLTEQLEQLASTPRRPG